MANEHSRTWVRTPTATRCISIYLPITASSRYATPLQELLPDAEKELREYLSYPLEETLASEKAAEVVADDMREVVDALLAAYDSGALLAGLQDGPDGFKVRALGVSPLKDERW